MTLARALTRDLELFGDEDSVRRRYETRYIPGETLYLDEVRPQSIADVILCNDVPERPVLRWNR